MRLIIHKPQLDQFFTELFANSQKTKPGLANEVGISDRTLRDWARGLYLPQVEIMEQLSKKYNTPLPTNYQTKPEHWQIPEIARMGAMARLAKYGAPGNIETRRMAGRISAEKRKLNPEYYRLLGCNMRKQIFRPRPSEALAELVGILLGDGGITSNQIKITLNRMSDKLYADYVVSAIYRIFKERPKVYFRKTVCIITLSGVEYVEFLISLGLKTGNKVKQQVKIPGWINQHRKWQFAALRGLIDTDGCIYIHKHKINKKLYEHIGLNFTNKSLPLADWVNTRLNSINLRPKQPKPYCVYAYGTQSVGRYLNVVGTSNPKHQAKYDGFVEKHPQNRYPVARVG